MVSLVRTTYMYIYGGHMREILRASGLRAKRERKTSIYTYIRSSSQIINVYKVHDRERERERKGLRLEFIYTRTVRLKNEKFIIRFFFLSYHRAHHSPSRIISYKI